MKLFGTDGLRGRAGEFPLDPVSVRRIGLALGGRIAKGSRRTVVVGGDTRASTPGIVGQLAAGIAEAGAVVAHAGVMTTPGVAEIVLELSAAAGVSVSASHNPWEDNGIKIFGADGRKWPDREEEALEKTLLADRGATGAGSLPPGAARDSGRLEAEAEADSSLREAYLERLAKSSPARLDGLHLLVDAGNGAAYRLGPEALRRAGATVTAIHDTPDGHNINAACGALHPESMAAAVREHRADLGVAYDGDADRSIFSDEAGRILDGDDILWIVATDWNRRGTLAAGGVVGTVMSNFGLESALAREGIAFRRSGVGDRNVARLMEETGAPLGGETSGHVLLPSSPAGDAIRTTLLIGAILAQSGGPLSRLATLKKVPQSLRNVRVSRRVPIDEIPSLTLAMQSAREELDGRGRILLRYSGTEPLLRILVEGEDGRQVAAVADDLETAVRAELVTAGSGAT